MRFTAAELREKLVKWTDDERVPSRCILVAEQAASDADIVEALIGMEAEVQQTMQHGESVGLYDALGKFLALIQQAKGQP